MNSRIDIKKFILKIERDFPVNNWKINDIHLWPVLRIRLFFYLIVLLENPSSNKTHPKDTPSKDANLLRSRIIKIRRNTKSVLRYFNFLFKLPKKEILFIGADAHRVNYKSSRYNRYFDVMIETQNLENKAMYFEYGISLDNQFNKELIYKFNEALKGFFLLYKKERNAMVNLDGYVGFLEFLSKQNLSFQEYINQNQNDKLKSWAEESFLLKIKFFTKVLKKISPKQVAILCYYSDDIMALCVAANKLNIETIEMQHGPQTDIHLSYGNWSVLPKEGYDMMPRTYWCWDEYSKNVIQKWSQNNKLYKVQVKGNPWIEYWKNKKQEYQYEEYILYSLQPHPITLEQLFTPSIINLIKENKTKWFIRLHPRQMQELDNIKRVLDKEGILELVNIHDATDDPLPQLITNAILHITHSSGSALEASYFGLDTILINEIGLTSFPQLIENGSAIYIDYKDEEFENKFNFQLNSKTVRVLN